MRKPVKPVWSLSTPSTLASLYSSVHEKSDKPVSRRIHKFRKEHSSVLISEEYLIYLLTPFQPCSDEHAYAVAVPNSMWCVGDEIFGDAVAGCAEEEGPVRLSFRMPIEVFLELEIVDLKKLE